MKPTFENSFWGVVKLALVVGGIIAVVAILAHSSVLLPLALLVLSGVLLFLFDRRTYNRLRAYLPWHVTEPSSQPMVDRNAHRTSAPDER